MLSMHICMAYIRLGINITLLKQAICKLPNYGAGGGGGVYISMLDCLIFS